MRGEARVYWNGNDDERGTAADGEQAMNALRCPNCGRLLESKQHMPFCSQRCRQIDLARWLDERYTLPIYRDDEDEESQAEERGEPEPE